jgi:acetylornithine deacetylase/succinyl-diaminopimelate desuccinylase-like protein
VLVAEGEEEIGSPNFPEIVLAPGPRDALGRSLGIFMPEASQDLDGSVTVELGSKGDVELDIVASGEKWGRGSTRDLHSSLAARVDAPAWRLVQGLNTLVTPKRRPGGRRILRSRPARERRRAPHARHLRAAHQRGRRETDGRSAALGARRELAPGARGLREPSDAHDRGSRRRLRRSGGKTIMPHRMTAKIDIRLVPDMTPEDTIAKSGHTWPTTASATWKSR